jgi:uncharacterized protein (DUF433 family)
MDEKALHERITYDLEIFGGKPTLHGFWLAIEIVLGMIATVLSPSVVLRATRYWEAWGKLRHPPDARTGRA